MATKKKTEEFVKPSSNVSFVRYSVKELSSVYETVCDCCDGDYKIKEKTVKYLPKPNPTDTSPENNARYKQYLERAIFYNVTKNTHAGLIGQIFAKEGQCELPAELEVLEDNCDGKGNSINQLAKEGISALLKTGRFGLFSDFPSVEKELSKDELIQQDIRPVIRLYDSRDIINWQIICIGAETIYSMIVLRELFELRIDEFETKNQYRYRVLKLNQDGNYQCDLHESSLQSINENNGVVNTVNMPSFGIAKSVIPTDVNGNFIKRIPFEFCGTESNVAEPNVPILYDISVLNIGHYRNSADYEESCYVVGQPTTYFAGLDQIWVKEVLNNTIQLGSRAGIPLPAGASAGILQPAPNIMPYEAMKHKEEQFLALGAKLVSPNSSTQTATEAEMNNTSETSILATLAKNASDCFENAIEHCQLFVKSTAEPIFKLNDDFEISKLTTAERNQLLNEWMKGGISFTEYRNNLRAGKVQLLEDEVAQTELDQEAQTALELEVNSTKALAEAAPKTVVSSVGTKK